MQRLSRRISRIDLGKANVFVLEGPDGISLVDAGVVGSLPPLERHLVRLGFGLGDVRRILVTHAHVDHVGGLREVQAATGAEVWAHPLEAPILRGEAPVVRPERASLGLRDRLLGDLIERGVGRVQPPAPVHRMVRAGDDLDAVLPGLRPFELPGHSAGQLGFWLEAERLLLGGDVMMHLTPWLTRPLAAYTADKAEADRSIQRVAALGVRTLGVGHGPALVGQAEPAIRRLAARLERGVGSQRLLS